MDKSLGVGLISGIVTAVVFLWLCLDFCRFKRARILAREADKLLFIQMAKGRVGIPSATYFSKENKKKAESQKKTGGFLKLLSLFTVKRNNADANVNSKSTRQPDNKDSVINEMTSEDIKSRDSKSQDVTANEDQAKISRGKETLLKMHPALEKLKRNSKNSFNEVIEKRRNSDIIIGHSMIKNCNLDRNTSSSSLPLRNDDAVPKNPKSNPKSKPLPPIRLTNNQQRA